MLELLIGLWVSIITQISKNRGISAKWIVLALSIIVGCWYFLGVKVFEEEIQIVWKNVLEVYGISQLVYNYCIKYFEEDKKNE